MAYGTKYILSFHNDVQELYEIYFDFLNFTGQSQPVCGTNGGLIIRSTATDDQKLSYLLGSECLLQVLIMQPLDATAQGFASPDISELVATYDNSIRITVYKDQNYKSCIFQGFVVVEDNSQPYLDPPYLLSLRAVDGIGLLKGVDLVDTNANAFAGAQSVISWVAQILYKTDQTLNIRAFFNIFHSSFNELNGALEQLYLNAITFQKAENPPTTNPGIDINALNADDCYTALEKICRCLRCRLFMEDGVWMLVNLYEHANPKGLSFVEYQLGAPSSGIIPVNPVAKGNNLSYNVNIGLEQIVHPVQNDQQLYLKMAKKWIELNYDYNSSANKICNQDLKESVLDATYNEVISSSVIDTSIVPTQNLQTLGYDANCWSHYNGIVVGIIVKPFPQSAPTATAFIRAVLDRLDFEILRHMVIKMTSTFTYMVSSNFLIDTGDVLQFSVNWRTRNSHPAGTYFVAMIVMDGVDGTHWAVDKINADDSNTKWLQVDANYQDGFGTPPAISVVVPSGQTTNAWTSVAAGMNTAPGVPLLKAPVSGTCRLILGTYISGGSDEAWFKDISLTIIPYLSGSYIQLKGDYNFASNQSANIKQTAKENVEISDSPKRYFKGALIASDGLSLLTADWHRKGIHESFRFTQIMARIYYANIWRMNQKIEGHFRGLVYINNQQISDIHPNGLLNSYYFVDGNYPTKRFILTSFEKDYTTAKWRAVCVEILSDSNDTGWYVPPQEVFNYNTQ